MGEVDTKAGAELMIPAGSALSRLSCGGLRWFGACAQGSDDDCYDVMVVMATAINK